MAVSQLAEAGYKFIADAAEPVLVTGAGGFIGSRLVRTLLSYGLRNIRCLVRSAGKSGIIAELAREFPEARVEFIQGNLLSRETCAAAAEEISIVFHLAAGVEKSYPGCFLNSVVTTRNLLDVILQQKSLRRFVNVSSIAVYTNERIRRGGMLDESCEVDTHFVERCEPYTYGKAKQDELVLEYAARFNLPYVIVRPSVVFGPGKAKITDRIGSSTFGVFLHLGHGNDIPLTFVDNCAEAIALAGLTPGVDGNIFNIVDDDLPKSREFLRQYKQKVRRFISIPVPYPVWHRFCGLWEDYARWSGGQLPPVFNRRACEIYWKGNTYSNSKAKQLLGWEPRVPMSEALETFFAYMREKERRAP